MDKASNKKKNYISGAKLPIKLAINGPQIKATMLLYHSVISVFEIRYLKNIFNGIFLIINEYDFISYLLLKCHN